MTNADSIPANYLLCHWRLQLLILRLPGLQDAVSKPIVEKEYSSFAGHSCADLAIVKGQSLQNLQQTVQSITHINPRFLHSCAFPCKLG